MACTTILFNIIVIIFISSKRTQSHPAATYKLLIQNLALSDIMYGFYLFIIAFTDVYYGGHYAIYDLQWKSNIMCHISSIMSTSSVVMSALCIVNITVHRHDRITKVEIQFQGHKHSNLFWSLLQIGSCYWTSFHNINK